MKPNRTGMVPPQSWQDVVDVRKEIPEPQKRIPMKLNEIVTCVLCEISEGLRRARSVGVKVERVDTIGGCPWGSNFGPGPSLRRKVHHCEHRGARSRGPSLIFPTVGVN